jgi:hypothetical protein
MDVDPVMDDDVFHFIEDTKRHWTCPVCRNAFISLQVQPACPACGSLSVKERPQSGDFHRAKHMTVRS